MGILKVSANNNPPLKEQIEYTKRTVPFVYIEKIRSGHRCWLLAYYYP